MKNSVLTAVKSRTILVVRSSVLEIGWAILGIHGSTERISK